MAAAAGTLEFLLLMFKVQSVKMWFCTGLIIFALMSPSRRPRRRLTADSSFSSFSSPASDTEQDVAVKLDQERAEIVAKYDKVGRLPKKEAAFQSRLCIIEATILKKL